MFCFGMPGLVPPPTDKDDSLAAAFFEYVQRGLAHFLGRAAHADFQRIHVAHQAHPVADALLYLGRCPSVCPSSKR